MSDNKLSQNGTDALRVALARTPARLMVGRAGPGYRTGTWLKLREDHAAALKEELLSTVAKHGLPKVILDLKNTRYVSSIAFWPLLTLRRQLAGQNGKLIICGLSGAVEEVFTTTKMVSSSGAMNAPFEMAPDKESALARLAVPPASS